MENNVSPALHTMQMISHWALVWMVALYAVKITQLMKKPGPPEKAELKGDRRAGAIESLLNVLRPWSMESTRTNIYFYAEFMIFHIAVAVTIASTFLIPFTPWLLTPPVVGVFMVFQALAFLIGVRRIHRRITRPEVRIISSFDDFFAIILMTVFFPVAFGANYYWIQGQADTAWMWGFFIMVTFFLIYVPFSKISHYVLYPFGRWMFGEIFGGRGILNRRAAS